MSLAQVQTELSTADGFSRRVVVARPAVGIAKALLAIAAIALGYNLLSTFRTWSENPGLDFFKIFMSTSGDNPASSVWFTLLVWGPLVVIPLAAIFYFYARSTAQRVESAAYLDFSANGSVVSLRPIGLAAMNGNTAIPAHLLGHSSVTPEAYEQAYNAITAHLASLDKKAVKQTQKSLAKLSSGPLPATLLLAGLPSELQLTGPISKTEWVAVLPSSAAGGKTRYFAVKP